MFGYESLLFLCKLCLHFSFCLSNSFINSLFSQLFSIGFRLHYERSFVKAVFRFIFFMVEVDHFVGFNNGFLVMNGNFRIHRQHFNLGIGDFTRRKIAQKMGKRSGFLVFHFCVAVIHCAYHLSPRGLRLLSSRLCRRSFVVVFLYPLAQDICKTVFIHRNHLIKAVLRRNTHTRTQIL